MPAILIESCSSIKNILKLSQFSVPHNWLISYLECYDTIGWDGCEKWENSSLILKDEELKKDIYLRDMQFIWGVFSAIPAEYTKEAILSHALPDLENSCYMRNHIVPQHPLAFLEISVWDGSDTYISSLDEKLLEPFYKLPYKVIDAEEDNKIMNRQLCRIQDILTHTVSNVSEIIANEIRWKCWHALFRNSNSEVSDAKITQEIKSTYEKISTDQYHFNYNTVWDPYTQKAK